MKKTSNKLNVSLESHQENIFFALINNSKNQLLALQKFVVQYHYFSVHQVHAFSGIFRVFSATYRFALSRLSEVMYEELGEGNLSRIHSTLLENFIDEIEGDVTNLPIMKSDVLDGVSEYVQCLYDAFWGTDRSVALAAYCFLENSAVKTYPQFVDLLNKVGLSDSSVEFFSIHAELEPEHAKVAYALALEYVTENNQIEAFNNQYKLLNDVWERFWKDIILKLNEN